MTFSRSTGSRVAAGCAVFAVVIAAFVGQEAGPTPRVVSKAMESRPSVEASMTGKRARPATLRRKVPRHAGPRQTPAAGLKPVRGYDRTHRLSRGRHISKENSFGDHLGAYNFHVE